MRPANSSITFCQRSGFRERRGRPAAGQLPICRPSDPAAPTAVSAPATAPGRSLGDLAPPSTPAAAARHVTLGFSGGADPRTCIFSGRESAPPPHYPSDQAKGNQFSPRWPCPERTRLFRPSTRSITTFPTPPELVRPRDQPRRENPLPVTLTGAARRIFCTCTKMSASVLVVPIPLTQGDRLQLPIGMSRGRAMSSLSPRARAPRSRSTSPSGAQVTFALEADEHKPL